MNTLPRFNDLATKPENTELEKMVLAAVSLLSVTTEFRAWSLEQIYSRVAAGADVRIAG